MSAEQKTKDLGRVFLPIASLLKNEDNPNKMTARDFDLLVDNYSRTGLTDPILVRPMPKIKGQKQQLYRIVGGHHRYDAALYLDFSDVPCTILPDDFDEDEERFQLVRMNMIRGKMDANAFFNLYSKLSEKYADDVLQDSFGFSEEAEFKKLINQTAKSIPDKALQEKFKAAAKEIKTVDGLSKLLNEIFTKYGNTLPHGYMVFDHAGQRNVWIEMEAKTLKAFDVIGTLCVENNRTVDDIVGSLLQLIAKGEVADLVAKLISKTPPVVLPAGLAVMPTKSNIQQMGVLDNED